MSNADLRSLISREIRAQAIRRRLRGKIVRAPAAANFDPVGAQGYTWLVDVDVGGNRILKDVPVKINGPKARFYAQLGFPVYLDSDAAGRYQVVAPADRGPGQGNRALLDEDTDTSSAAGLTGFSLVRQPYSHYQGVLPETFFDPATDPDTLLWLRTWERALGLPAGIIPASDADGADVLQIAGKSPTTINAAGGPDDPVYRRFDSLLPITTLCTVDFDGVNDGLDLSANVVESTAGQLSIFLLVNKDTVGSGDDVLLELANVRVLSRLTASDSWGFTTGAAASDSTSTVSSGFTLLELILSAYDDVDLYERGISLGNFSAAAAGLGLGASSLGYSAAAAGGTHPGRVLEVLVIDRTVSDADRIAIEAYFNQLAFTAYSRWSDGVTGYPATEVLDAEGNPV